MKFFRTKSEMADVKDSKEIAQAIQRVEKSLEELRHTIGYRRTMLKNADKKLQEFQDTIYAMLIEAEYSPKRRFYARNDDEDPSER